MQRRTFLSQFALGGLCLAATACSLPAITYLRPSSPTWRRRKAMPNAMQEIYPTVFQDKICIAGGLQSTNEPDAPFGHLAPTTDLHLYDPIQNSWSKGADLPEARHHLGLVTCQNKLYGIGGFYADRQNPWQVRANVYRSNEQLTAWHEVEALPIAQAESVYGCINDTIHVIGGRTLNTQNQLTDTSAHWVYDKGRWYQGAPLDIARNSAASVVHNGLLYIVGGRQFSQHNQNLTTLQCYDPKEDRWRNLAPMPKASAGLACVYHNGRMYVFGGEQYSYQHTKSGTKLIDARAFDSIWSYDLNSDSWRTEAFTMTTTRHGLGAVAVNNQVYLMGGAIQAGGTETVDLLETLVF
ncbi:Kelch repeat-containing protein (plasmid) [Pseudoalteromonas sp. T1lg65]|uniref:Kelch repeat-containing protein n=1 Tax=Pseudoalteromonas sp. T1lg65 TaxID=2077101 RepID=UPI003F7ADCB6